MDLLMSAQQGKARWCMDKHSAYSQSRHVYKAKILSRSSVNARDVRQESQHYLPC